MSHGCPTPYPQPWQPLTSFCLCEFNSSSSSKWNHTVFVLPCLSGFIPLSIMFPGLVVAHVRIPFFVWMNNAPLCVHTTLCLPIHLLTGRLQRCFHLLTILNSAALSTEYWWESPGCSGVFVCLFTCLTILFLTNSYTAFSMWQALPVTSMTSFNSPNTYKAGVTITPILQRRKWRHRKVK